MSHLWRQTTSNHEASWDYQETGRLYHGVRETLLRSLLWEILLRSLGDSIVAIMESGVTSLGDSIVALLVALLLLWSLGGSIMESGWVWVTLLRSMGDLLRSLGEESGRLYCRVWEGVQETLSWSPGDSIMESRRLYHGVQETRLRDSIIESRRLDQDANFFFFFFFFFGGG